MLSRAPAKAAVHSSDQHCHMLLCNSQAYGLYLLRLCCRDYLCAAPLPQDSTASSIDMPFAQQSSAPSFSDLSSRAAEHLEASHESRSAEPEVSPLAGRVQSFLMLLDAHFACAFYSLLPDGVLMTNKPAACLLSLTSAVRSRSCALCMPTAP